MPYGHGSCLVTGLLLLAACAPQEVTLAEFSGEVAWMREEHTGFVQVGVNAEEAPQLAVLRVQALGADGAFAFPDLPVGEAMLTGEVHAGEEVVCELYAAPRRLGPEGVHLVFDWCGGFE